LSGFATTASSCSGDDGEPLYLQGYLLDITPERELQEQLRLQALFDPLTGLASRAFFHEQLEHAVSIRTENEPGTAVVFIDLDEFKQINDQYGHSVGDEVLAILGARLKTVIRAGDSVARLGGDEFAVLLTSVREPAEPAIVAERLLEQITAPIEVAGRHLLITASIGIALESSGTELLKQADAAMYRAKANGDADYAFYDDELDQAALNRFKRIAEMRQAIADKQFTLAYQPVVNLVPFEVVGLEHCCGGSTRRGNAALDFIARRGVRADRADRALGPARGLLLRLAPARAARP
jgi:diguanylate cyclase (GGDEF)-like protein